ncbi:acetylornithine deacetylase [Neisseria weaveri]|uniref:Probable succinyl-diaminopimelate desuccinylase n=1 Tax=Neisseria weaveri TaxID=28091 RepID=A0A3S4ZLC7_9NEIS|nr:acetylornithine deacetylase [Neisseria weaveri]EGV35608.1 acetylornithine deacetylase [Neisseria weaveri ATCC 51223]EGV38347.1 acetylornithine deacetylase [Neisseria weaveri LMG 5135]SAY51727.1 succinyl-diaminopimelate desuccinylase [Neisseria weaveri]VEJ51082.1 succinyl-diaminopimelate desuccinylase [Neisseria weaveri]
MNTVDHLKTLIAFDTTSRLSNLALIEHVAAYLEQHGLKPWLSYNAERTKANLFATVPAADGSINGGLIFSGHTDVVPTDGQIWQSDPYTADIRNGRLYGRGAADMKGFIAAVLAAVPHMKQTRLARPLHIALSYDEEVGCLGAPVMLDQLRAHGLSPEHCIVGEPTSMKMVVAHKGIQTYTCRIHGKAAHSSLTPQGVNAIEYAAELITFIRQLSGRLKNRSDNDPAFDVPFSTLSVNTIHGGNAVNIIPQSCELQFDCRNLPHMSADEILRPIEDYIRHTLEPHMQAQDSRCRIELQQNAAVPAMPAAEAETLHRLVASLTDSQTAEKVAYTTEGGQFKQAGIHTVICGPGSIEQAHKPDEYIELEQLARCDAFLEKMIAAHSVR